MVRAKTKQQAQRVLERYLLCITADSPNLPLTLCRLAKTQLPFKWNNLCFKDRRAVAKYNTITFEGTIFQIPKKSPFRSHANKRTMCMCCWTAPSSSSTKMKKSPPKQPRIWPISNERQAGRLPLWTYDELSESIS